MRRKYSDYMNWAKTRSHARFNLATSGVGSFPLRELPIGIDDLEINGDTKYGFPPLRQALAAKCGVSPDCVVTADGASQANYLATAAILEPGDEVLIEQPAYELLVSAAQFTGATVKRFLRREENAYALDVEEIRRNITSKTRLIVITNLHNPTSVQANPAVFAKIGALAREAGARVLVDEIYVDAIYENTPTSVFHLGPEFVVTNSLTKVYGVSGLRCGWILAEPELAWAMYRLNDLFGSIPSHPGNQIAVRVLEHLDMVRDRARHVVEADRALFEAFLGEHPQVIAPRTTHGTTAFLRLAGGGAPEFVERLRAEYDTSVVPGRFFDTPDHFRVGMGVNTAMFSEGLRRMGELLREFRPA
ncbi:pyridoxal phosphate-dependent aminotransferase [uncultured Paludibaculum sp.]|uniref:pyridoxal phosphate-dependent aminotransferase n=1 Tax=uncultured Paludibaculum sp. TaxID=1765020 RepID=UPI002AAAB3C5|nr:pyridoxal phosphate-dependent aminotransferase [uncultured Paludibaculum sp.]